MAFKKAPLDKRRKTILKGKIKTPITSKIMGAPKNKGC
jgi:hypothetical protein